MTNQEADSQLLAPEETVASDLEVQLESKSEEVEKYKDMYIRSLAETDNLRKRFEKDKVDLLKYGQENILKEFLPILDSFEKALSQAANFNATELDSSQLTNYADGVKLVKHQLEEVLHKYGLVSIKALGAKFDPQLHQAIQKIEDDEITQEEVAQVYAPGYCLHGRLLRPAMVSVRVPVSK